MKRFFLLLSIVILLTTLTASAQKSKPKPAPKKTPPPATVAKLDEKEEFEKALAVTTAPERINALKKFLNDFPKTENRARALELMVSARAEIGEEKLRLSETEDGLKMFVLAVSEAPSPMSDELYTKVILQFPTNLFFRGQQAAAIEIAKFIEQKADGNPNQLLGLAAFYLGIENGDEARRIAEKALAINANLPAAYQTLGLANRLNFDLDGAVAAYTKALELDAGSLVSRRSLAEMKRAAGKPLEAAALYREILEKEPGEGASQTGLVLALFDAEKQTEAETELAKSLEANPNNLLLLVGAAYWYAGKNQTEKALEYAQKAVAVEPRYTWAHIASARALLAQNKPAEAEKALLIARQYGNFPTLDYEIASARAAAGFYEEAAQDLRKSFTVTKDGAAVQTRLGNRITKEAASFIELLSAERRASIFQPLAADSAENAERMKNLLYFAQKLDSKDATETEIADAAESFVKGDDRTKTHRQIYAANRLLQKKIALPKALELTQAAVRGVDASLEIESPASFVLAEELFESRSLAIARGQLIVVPALSRQTLSTILRGRIEEIAGWTLYNQEKPAEAAVRLKRAVGILPEKSAWWRSSMWRLGASLEAAGKLPDALDAYIKSYTSGEPDTVRRSVIETLYQRINGTLDGLDTRLEGKPKRETSFLIKQPETSETAKTQTSPSPVAEEKSASKPEVSPSTETTSEPAPQTAPKTPETPGIKPETAPAPGVVPSPSPSPEETPQTKAEPTPVAEPTPSPQPEPTPVAETSPSPTPQTGVEPSPTVESSPTPTPRETPQPGPTPEVTPAPTPTPEKSPEPANDPPAVTKTAPVTETKIEPTPTPSPESSPAPETTPTPEIKSEPPPTPETKSEPAPEKSAEPNLSNSKLQVVVTDNLAKNTLAQNIPKPAPQTENSPVPEPVKDEPPTETSPTTPVENAPPAENRSKRTEPPPGTANNSDPSSKPQVIVTENNPAPPQNSTKVKNIPPNPQTRPRTLFDPVVINVQKPENAPLKTTGSPEKPAEPVETEKRDVESKPEAKPLIDESVASGAQRPRVVVTDNLANKIAPCVLTVSQEKVSLVSGGGMIGISVGYEEANGEPAKITAASNSLRDVVVELDPEISRQSGQAFFVIKSVSTKTGAFTVTFEAPCGRKEVRVTVR